MGILKHTPPANEMHSFLAARRSGSLPAPCPPPLGRLRFLDCVVLGDDVVDAGSEGVATGIVVKRPVPQWRLDCDRDHTGD